ncbi:MFS transporter [Mariniluteicoccus endophyticus]
MSLPLFLVAEGASLFGNSAIAIVLPWLILSRTHDPATAGFVSMVTGLPAVVAALVGGHLIDRVGRRRMAVLADCGSALSVAALAVVDRLWGLDVGWFVVLGLAGALFDVPGMTARETLMANVSEASGVSLDRIAGLRQTIFGLSFLAGPALAGVLMSVLDPVRVVWITAGCSALAALATALMPLRPAPAVDPGTKDSPLSGLAVVRANPGLLAVLIISFASTLPVAPLLSVVLPAHFQRMDAPGLLGAATSGYAVGSIIGSIVYAVGLSRWRWPTWLVSLALYTASFALIATLSGFWVVAAGMAVAGIAGGLMGPIFTVGMTENVPDAQRGRVFGLLNALALVAAPLGLGLVALLLSRWPLDVGAWALLVVWAPAAVYGVVAPGLRAFVEPEEEVAVVDHLPAG